MKEKTQLKLIEELEINQRQLRENQELRDQVNRELEAKVRERTTQIQRQAEEIERMNAMLEARNHTLQRDVTEIAKARILRKKITFAEFKQTYPDEISCVKYLAQLKWKRGYRCHKCGNPTFTENAQTYDRRCKKCRYNESVTVHTIFHRLKFPIDKAFYMVFLIRTGKEVSLEELSNVLELRKETCWMFKKKILQAIQRKKPTKNYDDWEYLLERQP